MQFLDKQIGLFNLFSAPGPASDEAVGAITRVSGAWLQQAAGYAVRAADACLADAHRQHMLRCRRLVGH